MATVPGWGQQVGANESSAGSCTLATATACSVQGLGQNDWKGSGAEHEPAV